MDVVAEIEDFDRSCFTAMEVELNSFASVRKFVADLDGFRLNKPTMQVNYLSHFLLVSLLMEDMARADPRIALAGSATATTTPPGGGGVYPIADLKDLDGLKAGFKNPVSMIDGYNFIGAKAYKDSKLCLMMLSNMLHDKYHKQTGIVFSSIYPGCIAESPLPREAALVPQVLPVFMKYITGGFVGEEEAGQRLFQVAHDPRCAKSGVYWGWNGGPREGRGAEALEKGGQIAGAAARAAAGTPSSNDQSDKVLDVEKTATLWKYSSIVTGAEWPEANQPKSPCPTLKVIGAVTDFMNAKEEAKRMGDQPGMVAGKGIVVTGAVAKAADTVLDKTVFRLLRLAQRLLLGKMPDAATDGSFQATEARRRTGGLLGIFRRKKRAAEEEDAAAVLEAEAVEADAAPLDPEEEAKLRIREELELELRAKIQDQNADRTADDDAAALDDGAPSRAGRRPRLAPASGEKADGREAELEAPRVGRGRVALGLEELGGLGRGVRALLRGAAGAPRVVELALEGLGLALRLREGLGEGRVFGGLGREVPGVPAPRSNAQPKRLVAPGASVTLN
ncbi:hypothetical protein JL721_11597 [Aureococcus anophagefferens]|nr:hypothetical protein JL721_11597 [Aureococcus anophagefferens]